MDDMWIIDKKFILGTLLFLFAGQLAFLFSVWVRLNMQWFDIPLHFGGGAVVAMAFLAILDKRPNLFDLKKNIFISLLFIASFVLFIGVFWEFYEFIVGYFHRTVLNSGFIKMTLEDTLFDLVNDLLGGLAVGVIYFRYKNKEERSIF